MISFFILIVVLSITGTLNAEQELIEIKPEFAGPIFGAVTKCVAQTQFTQEALERARAKEDTEDESYKKFLFCIYREAGYVNQNGRLDVEKAALLFPSEFNIKPILEKCDKDDKDPVETVVNFQKCFGENSPVLLAV